MAVLLGASKQRAKRRGLRHTLTTEWLTKAIEKGTCALTGLPFYLGPHQYKHAHPLSPSIDRIDPSRGYIPSNVQLVCAAVNAAKGEYSLDVLKMIARTFLQQNED